MIELEARTAITGILKSQFSNLTEIESGIVRGERRYRDRCYAIAYIDFDDDVVGRAKHLQTFQERLLGADYFNNPYQLRWNNYLYVLAGPRSIQAADYKWAKATIEGNREYARKYVVTIDDMRKLLSDVLLSAPEHAITTADVTETWATLLEAGQLDVLLDKPARTKSVDLIENGRASRQVVLQKSYELKPKDIALTKGFLHRLHIKTFRPIHNGRTFEFADVNLIVGPNGSGKTSLLEAIEYLYCGHNRRDEVQGLYTLDGAVQLQSTNYLETIMSTTDIPRIKNRNRNWYRREIYQSKGILDSFTRYNFLDTDAAFRISNELDPAVLSEDIRRLLIGADASTLSDYLEKVKESVDVRSKELTREIRFDAERGDNLKKDLERLKRTPSHAASLAKTFRAGLRECGWKAKEIDVEGVVHESERSNIESVSRLLGRIYTLTAFSPISKFALRNHVSVLNARRSSAVPLELERARVAQALVQSKHELVRCKQMAELLSEWCTYCVADAPKSIRKIESGREDVRSAYERLGTLVSISVPQLSDEYKGLVLGAAARKNAVEVANAKEEVKTAELAQRNVRSLQESFELARRQLQDAARQLVAQTGRDDVCPVCETSHNPGELHVKIEALIDARASTDVTDLAKLLQASKAREAQTSRNRKDLEVLVNICSKLGIDQMTTTAEEVATTLHRQQQVLQQSVESLRLAEEVVAGFAFVGLSTGRYHELRRQMLSHFGDRNDIEDVNILEQAKKDVGATIVGLHEEAVGLAKVLEDVSEKLLVLVRENAMPKSFAEINSADTVLKSLEEELSRARAALGLAEEIEEFVALPEDHPLSELENNIANVAEAFDRAWHAVREEQAAGAAIKQVQQSYDNSQVELHKKKKRVERLTDAHHVLTNLLENYSLDAATENVFTTIKDQINDVFSRIHSPRQYEFSISDNALLVTRDTNMPWTLNKVSTGQRAAFALSIFLALNSTASSAPPVILIDDPIAYVDELNVLSFFDYLRALVLHSRRQVFFATADTKVAALFDKKFSFLESQRYRRLTLTTN